MFPNLLILEYKMDLKSSYLLITFLSIQFTIAAAVSVPPLPTEGEQLYLSSDNSVLPDYSLIKEGQLPPSEGLWCQTSNSSLTINWYLPNGTLVPTTNVTGLPVYSYSAPGQLGLLLTDLIGSYQGLYSCVISNGGSNSSTLVAAVVRNTEYDSAVGPSVAGDLHFSLLSSIDSPQVSFSLSFNVTNRPPTNVTCSVNGTVIPVNGSDVHRRAIGSTLNNILIEVMVVIKIRQAGLYNCTVSNARVDYVHVYPATTNGRFISVTNPPSDVLVNRTGLTSFNVSWTPPSFLSVPLAGYQIFYQPTTGANVMSGVKIVSNDSQTVTIDDLIFNVTYEIFAVSVGGDLPSEHSNAVTATTGVTFNITSHPPLIPFIGDTDITLTCAVSLDVPMIVFQLVWLDPNDIVISTNSVNMNQSRPDVSIQSIDLSLSLIDPATIGMYSCMANFSNYNVTARTDYELIGQVPDINVTVSNIYGDLSSVEGTYTDLLCAVSNVHGLMSLTNVSWYYNGAEISNGTDYTLSKEGSDLLRINQLSVSRDNGGVYSCVVSVDSTQYLVGGMGNDSLTLSVQSFTSNNVDISISFSKPNLVFGDSFILQCTVTLPDRYIYQPTSFEAKFRTFADLPVTNNILLPGVNEEAIVTNGSTYIQRYNFTTITDRYLHPYFCNVAFANGVTKDTDLKQLMAQLTPPSLSFNDDVIQVYESTPLIITCNIILPPVSINRHEVGSWTGPNGQPVEVTFNGRITVSGINGHNRNVLRISPADNGDQSIFNDTGFYTYTSSISTVDDNILPAASNATVFVRILDLPPLQVGINVTGRSIFGQNVTLNCSVEPITNLEVSIIWSRNDTLLSTSTGDDGFSILPLRSIDNSYNGVYTCTVEYNVTTTGDNSSVDREYELIVQDLGSPHNLSSSSVTPFTIELSWDQPSLLTFGPFERYELTISYDNGTNGTTVKLDPVHNTYQLNGLSPHQLVMFKISVLYPEGYGPLVSLNVTTLQYESTPVRNLTIDYQSVLIVWSPPLVPNGLIEYYRLVLTQYKDSLVANVTITEATVYNISSLVAPGVPYQVSLWPVNGAGPGSSQHLLFFVQEIAPLPVSNVSQTRINGTHAMVHWSPLSLREARGFIEAYTIEYGPVAEQRRSKRQLSSVTVGSDVRSVLLNDLMPGSSYGITVGATNDGGTGDTSEPTISDRPPTSNFQLQIRPIESCNDNKDTLIDVVQSVLVDAISSNCSCSFQEEYISGESLNCSNSSAYYRANITSFGSINSTILIDYISQWISMGPNISSSIMIDPSCPTLYVSNDDPFCAVVASPSPSVTGPPTEGTNGSLLVTVIVVIVAVVLVLVILIVITGGIVYCLYKRNKPKTKDQLERHPLSSSYYKNDFKASDMLPEEEEDGIYEPLDPEGNLRVSRNKSLTTTLPLPPVPQGGGGERPIPRSERSQSVIIPGTAATPTRLLPLPPTPPSLNEVHTNYVTPPTLSNGSQPLPLSESLPSRLSGLKTGAFSPGLGSLNEETAADINKVIAGGTTKPKGFTSTSSAASVQSIGSKRASNLTIASHSMSDRGPLSPATSGSPVLSPANVLSPQYETLMSPLYANADAKEVAKRTASSEEEDEKYIVMKGTGYADPIELRKTDPTTSPQEYETPVSSRGGTPVPTSRPGSKAAVTLSKSLSPRDRVSSCNSVSSREEGGPFNIDDSDIYSKPVIPNIYSDDIDDDATDPKGHEYAIPEASPKPPLSPIPITGSDWLYAEPNSPSSTGSVPQDYEVPVITKQMPASPLHITAQEYQVPVVSSNEVSPQTSMDHQSPSLDTKPVNGEEHHLLHQEYDIPAVPSRDDDPKIIEESESMVMDSSSMENKELGEEEVAAVMDTGTGSNERETEEVQLYIEEKYEEEEEETDDKEDEMKRKKENGGPGLGEVAKNGGGTCTCIGTMTDNRDKNQEKDDNNVMISDEIGTNL